MTNSNGIAITAIGLRHYELSVLLSVPIAKKYLPLSDFENIYKGIFELRFSLLLLGLGLLQ